MKIIVLNIIFKKEEQKKRDLFWYLSALLFHYNSLDKKTWFFIINTRANAKNV